jgi:hypothetical protein
MNEYRSARAPNFNSSGELPRSLSAMTLQLAAVSRLLRAFSQLPKEPQASPATWFLRVTIVIDYRHFRTM